MIACPGGGGGKVLRRSFDRASGKSACTWSAPGVAKQRLVLAQIATDAKSNEIPPCRSCWEMLLLKGTIVTTERSIQRAIAQQIVDQGGDYVLALKGNQVRCMMTSAGFSTIRRQGDYGKPAVDGDHGRIETRTASVSTDIAWLQRDHNWPGLTAIGKVVRRREPPHKPPPRRLLPLSTALSGERFNEVVRSHWGVENRLHWRLDVG